jgi:predicted permease
LKKPGFLDDFFVYKQSPMNVILSAIIPVIAIVFVGYIVGKKVAIDLSTLSKMALYVLYPALIIDVLYHTSLTLENAIGMFLGFTLSFFLLGAIAWLLAKKLGFSTALQKSFVSTSTMSNCGNMGLPIILFALGQAGLDRATIYLIAWNIIILVVVPPFLKGGGFWSALKFTLKLPLIWGVIIGLVLRTTDIELPWKLADALKMLSQAAIPDALLFLGIKIATSPLQISFYEVGASSMRLIGGALIGLIIGKILNLDQLDLQVLVLQNAMPTAVGALLMVNEFGGDSARTARVVVSSTLLSFITIPFILWLIV